MSSRYSRSELAFLALVIIIFAVIGPTLGIPFMHEMTDLITRLI